jgi:hypothetical protein
MRINTEVNHYFRWLVRASVKPCGLKYLASVGDLERAHSVLHFSAARAWAEEELMIRETEGHIRNLLNQRDHGSAKEEGAACAQVKICRDFFLVLKLIPKIYA